ncbi:hypothetical protein Bhyg_03031, partial [Pseudolycoriella hygida]
VDNNKFFAQKGAGIDCDSFRSFIENTPQQNKIWATLMCSEWNCCSMELLFCSGSIWRTKLLQFHSNCFADSHCHLFNVLKILEHCQQRIFNEFFACSLCTLSRSNQY